MGLSDYRDMRPERAERSRRRFESKFEKADGCWIWQGTIINSGYGTYGRRPAHRVSYELYVGPLPEGYSIVHHKCEVKLCVNPEHLEVVTQGENLQRHADKRTGIADLGIVYETRKGNDARENERGV